MKHYGAEDAIRLEATAERRTATRAKVQDYMNRTGLSVSDFARRIGYGSSTFRMFLTDRYQHISGNDTHITRKIEEFIAAHPIAPPRKVAGELFETANVQLIRSTFAKLLDRPRIFVIYAPPGSQKSFVIEHEIYALNLREQAPERPLRAHLVYVRKNIRPTDLMKRIAVACGVSADGNIDRIIGNLRYEFTGKRVLLCFDEAQRMSQDCFDVVCELYDRDPFFSLLFYGSHDLFLRWERASATLEQWNSRIAKKVRLPGCTYDEAQQIVLREVGHILEASQSKPQRAGAKRLSVGELVARLIQAATVPDVYVPVPEGAPQATYINIRTLTTALDELRSQFEAEQQIPAIAATPIPINQQKESAA